MPGRSFSTDGYRYGFNGKEKDDEVKGGGNFLNFETRLLDPRLGKFLSVDPREDEYVGWSPYHFGANNPARIIDPTGEGWGDRVVGWAMGVVTNLVPATTHARSFYHPNGVEAAQDYNAALRGVDDAATIVGAGTIITGGGMTTGGTAVGLAGTTVTVGSGGTLAVVAAPTAVAGYGVAATGLGVTAVGGYMYAVSSENRAGGYNYGETEQKTTTSNDVETKTEQQASTTNNAGRQGKQERLKEIAKDPKASSADKDWIKSEQNQIANGKRTSIRNPPGKDLAHERGREAAKGYSYQHSNLQDRGLHRLQHKYDKNGTLNKERPAVAQPAVTTQTGL